MAERTRSELDVYVRKITNKLLGEPWKTSACGYLRMEYNAAVMREGRNPARMYVNRKLYELVESELSVTEHILMSGPNLDYMKFKQADLIPDHDIPSDDYMIRFEWE